MFELTPENFQKFFEQAAKANTSAWTEQATYIEGLVKRNTDCFSSLASARMNSFKDMSKAESLNDAFETDRVFQKEVRSELGRLQDDNVKAWETLRDNLKAIYTPSAKAA